MARAADLVQLPRRAGGRAPEHAGAHAVRIKPQDVTERPEGHRPRLVIILKPRAGLLDEAGGRGEALQIEHGLRQDGTAEPLLRTPRARGPHALGIGRIVRDGGTDRDRADPAIAAGCWSANRRHTCHDPLSTRLPRIRVRRVLA
jgi:hypothetical protein